MTGKNNAVNESLSALMDGEHNELDLRRVLKAAESQPALGDTWANYQLARQVIKKDVALVCDEGFLSGIQEAIADDPAPEQAKKPFVVWQGFMGKAAVAACFTFAFLIGVNQWSPSDTPVSENLAASNVEGHESMAVVPDGFELPPLTARTVSTLPNQSSPTNVGPFSQKAKLSSQHGVHTSPLSPEVEAHIQRLMLLHAESSAASGGLGVMPFTRVTSPEQDLNPER